MKRELRYVLAAVWIPVLALLAIALIVTQSTDVTFRQLFQDANTVTGVPFYVGSLSMLGVILWAMTAAVCLFVAVRPDAIAGDLRRLLLVSGVFTALLMVDDAFLVHDDILPNYAGVSGEVYGVVYALAMTAYVVAFRRLLLATNYLLLGVALVLFGISAVTDLASHQLSQMLPTPLVEGVEDGSKLLGIATWLAYFVSVSRQALRSYQAIPT